MNLAFGAMGGVGAWVGDGGEIESHAQLGKTEAGCDGGEAPKGVGGTSDNTYYVNCTVWRKK
jgi:hypothetical protein